MYDGELEINSQTINFKQTFLFHREIINNRLKLETLL
jgi:hypothetical protein